MENHAGYALLISVLAGLSTLIGALGVLFFGRSSRKMVAISLGFAGGLMVSVSMADLFPAGREYLEEVMPHGGAAVLSVLFMAVGMLFAFLIERFVPHEGHHGHTHETHTHENAIQDKLFRVGLVSMLAIGLHSFPEGIAVFMAGYGDKGIGLTLALAIAMHNIPIGISIAMPVYVSTGSRFKAFFYTFLTGIAGPLGAFLAFFALRPLIGPAFLGAVFSAVAGIMITIAIEEMIPSSREYGHEKLAVGATFLGLLVMPLIHIIE